MASDLERMQRLAFDAEAAADLLVAARREQRLLDVRRPGPRSLDDAYRVQDEVSRRLGPIVGWKVGAKGPDAVPTAAPLPTGLVRKSPQDWPAAAFGMIGIEAEIAFRMGDAIESRSGPVAPDEV